MSHTHESKTLHYIHSIDFSLIAADVTVGFLQRLFVRMHEHKKS